VDTEWRRIPEFRQYEINTQGQIRHRINLNILKVQQPDKNPFVGLQKDGKQHSRSPKKLVLTAFPELRSK